MRAKSMIVNVNKGERKRGRVRKVGEHKTKRVRGNIRHQSSHLRRKEGATMNKTASNHSSKKSPFSHQSLKLVPSEMCSSCSLRLLEGSHHAKDSTETHNSPGAHSKVQIGEGTVPTISVEGACRGRRC